MNLLETIDALRLAVGSGSLTPETAASMLSVETDGALTPAQALDVINRTPEWER